MAKVQLVPGGDSGVNGTLYMKQNTVGGAVLITGVIHNLSEGKHGFHIHMDGKLGNNCKDAGGHFNPFMVSVACKTVTEIFLDGQLIPTSWCNWLHSPLNSFFMAIDSAISV